MGVREIFVSAFKILERYFFLTLRGPLFTPPCTRVVVPLRALSLFRY